MTKLTLDRSHGTWFKAEEWDTLTGGLPVYRGFTRPLEGTMTLDAPTDRKPKNIPEVAHRIIDDWFLEKFGVNFRTRAVYGTGSLENAQSHAGPDGEVAIIRPNADFSFCWSPHSYDLFGEYAELKSDDEIMTMLEKLEFRADNLEQAVMSGYEIMFASETFTVERLMTI